MESTTLSEPMIESSTVIEPRGHDADPAQAAHKEPDAPDAKEPAPKEPAAKESRLDTIKRAAAELDKQNAESAKEPKEPAKEVTTAKDEIKAQPEKAEGEPAPVAEKVTKPSEGRKIIEAPARFLPRAKELWNNVPHPVREEFERVMKENETETAKYRESHAFREELREFEEMAKSNNTTVKNAITNYVGLERKFSEDQSQGYKQIIQNLNSTPQQAIGHILRAYGVSPQQLVQHMQNFPHEYTALAQQRQAPQMQPQQQIQQQRQQDPEIAALKQEVESMRAERVANEIIAPFAREYPEYHDHEGQIAEVLKSGIIERIHGNGLSPRDKLEAALFMVAPNIRRSSQANPEDTVQSPYTNDITPAVDLRGTKSIKGAPTPGADSSARRGKSMSRNEAIAAAAAELGLRL